GAPGGAGRPGVPHALADRLRREARRSVDRLDHRSRHRGHGSGGAAAEPQGQAHPGTARPRRVVDPLADGAPPGRPGLRIRCPLLSAARTTVCGMPRSDGYPSEYAERVLEFVRTIPAGKVMTYGDVAEYLGAGSARSVGAVMATWGADAPWWRV